MDISGSATSCPEYLKLTRRIVDAIQAILLNMLFLLCFLNSRPDPWLILPPSVVLTVENSRLFAAVDQFAG